MSALKKFSAFFIARKMKGKKKDIKSKKEEASNEENQLEELKAQLEVLEKEKQDLQDKFTRLFAEFDNYKKRTAREKLDLINSAGADVLVSMIPVLDDFERAIKASGEEEKEGILLIYNKLKSSLIGKGLEALETQVGDDFDLDLHEAITKIPAPEDKMKEKVVDVIEKGYKIGDKVIRFAKVVIGE